MARVLSKKNTRMVMTGPSSQPTDFWAEYRVVDGDETETPKRLEFEDTDFNSKIKDLWSGMISTVKSKENLS